MNKIPAFSIIEIITVMIITSIVIAASFSAYFNIEKIMNLTLKQNKLNDEITILYSVLKNDVEKSYFMTNYFDELSLTYNNGDQIIYTFNNHFITREMKNYKDTFFVAIKDLNFTPLSNNSNYIHFFNFNIYFESNIFPIYIQKDYYPDFWINLNINNK